MSEEHTEISAERVHTLDRETIVVGDFDASGLILDVGGGGEGLIGMLKGDRVVAIDRSRRELEEAASGPLKIVMDARDLQFLDETFEVVTSFYTLMYVDRRDHRQVFEEAYRVLMPGGRFLIWGGSIPERLNEERDVLVFPLLVELPAAAVETGYGVAWPDEPFGLSDCIELARGVGFEVLSRWATGPAFHLSLGKA